MQRSEFKFSNPNLIALNFHLNDCSNKQDDPEIEMFISIKTKVDKKSDVEAAVELTIEIGEESDSFPFFINLVIGATFKLDIARNQAEFDRLLEVNASALLLSYARPIVSSITSQAGMKPINLPFINFMSQPSKDTV